MDNLKLFAIDKDTGEKNEIDDLYWFEEQGVHDWGGEAHYEKYWFEFYVGDRLIYTTKPWSPPPPDGYALPTIRWQINGGDWQEAKL